MKVKTHSVHFRADARLTDHIEKKLARLEHLFDRILEADVFLKLENSGQVRDKVAEIRLKIPGGEIFEKKTSRTFEGAIDNAIRSLREQVVRHKERKREALAA